MFLAAHWAERWVPGSIGLLITGIPLGFFVRELVLGLASYAWPKVPAKIVSSQVVNGRQLARHRSGYACITYAYEVDGVTQTSDRLKFGQHIEADLRVAQRLVETHAPNSETTIRVKGGWATLFPGPSSWLYFWVPLLAFLFGTVLYELLTGS